MKEPKRPNRNSEWGQWANDLIDWLLSTRVQASPTVKATSTTRGTFLEAVDKASTPSERGEIFRGRWDPTVSYARGDATYVDTHPDFAPLEFPGLYVCLADIAGDSGNSEPGADGLHWELYSRQFWERILIGPTIELISRAAVGEHGRITITEPTAFPETARIINLNVVAGGFGFPGMTLPAVIEPRRVVFSNDGGATFFQMVLLCTEPQDYP
jgi:hypothetical protein